MRQKSKYVTMFREYCPQLMETLRGVLIAILLIVTSGGKNQLTINVKQIFVHHCESLWAG